jgi:uncharacterized membrane protein YgdD (TMEM256/DUF423 family)
MPNRFYVFIAGLCGALGVIFSAIAAHGGSTNMDTAASFLLVHALVLLVIGLTVLNSIFRWSGALLFVGLMLFVGDLASRDFFDDRLFAMAAPAGGFLLIVGWIGIAVSALLPRRLLG